MNTRSFATLPSAGRKCAAALMCAALVFTAGGVSSFPVNAAGSVEMSTSYPGISVKPGQDVSFSLDFSNPGSTGESVSLSQSGLPSGWTGDFEGNGSEISEVYVKANSDAVSSSGSNSNDGLATYKVQVPDDAKNGDYTVTLKADSSTLKLKMHVTDEDTGTSGLTTDYTDQQGPTGTTFTFNTTLQNTTSEKQSYSLSADAPTGWQVSFKPSSGSTQVASVDVDANGSESLTVTVTPPDKVDAGDYEIPINAVSATQSLKTTLKVTITGTYNTQVTTSDGTLSFTANANHKKAVTLTVTNNGNIDLTNLNLTASAPTDWTTEFSESTIDSLAAGKSKTVTMYVTPAKNAVSGDYQMTVTASNDQNSVDTTMRVTVKTSTAWGIAGVAIIVVIIAALLGVFHKFGRH